MIPQILAAIVGRRIAEATTPDPGAASELAAVHTQLSAAQQEIVRLGAALSTSEKDRRTAQSENASLRAANRELGDRAQQRRPDRMVAPSGDADSYWRRLWELDRRACVELEDRLAVAEGRPTPRSA